MVQSAEAVTSVSVSPPILMISASADLSELLSLLAGSIDHVPSGMRIYADKSIASDIVSILKKYGLNATARAAHTLSYPCVVIRKSFGYVMVTVYNQAGVAIYTSRYEYKKFLEEFEKEVAKKYGDKDVETGVEDVDLHGAAGDQDKQIGDNNSDKDGEEKIEIYIAPKERRRRRKVEIDI